MDENEIARQWCQLHDVHQDDPAHAYVYPDCERRLRDSTPDEDSVVLLSLAREALKSEL